jgi:hypothetical protein
MIKKERKKLYKSKEETADFGTFKYFVRPFMRFKQLTSS